MTSVDLEERDQQLVALLRQDKAAFLREYRRAMHLSEDAALSGMLDRDMVCAILDLEFPARKAARQMVPE